MLLAAANIISVVGLLAAHRAASRQRSRCCGVAQVAVGLQGSISQEEVAMQRHVADMGTYVATHEAAVQRARDHLQQVRASVWGGGWRG